MDLLDEAKQLLEADEHRDDVWRDRERRLVLSFAGERFHLAALGPSGGGHVAFVPWPTTWQRPSIGSASGRIAIATSSLRLSLDPSQLYALGARRRIRSEVDPNAEAKLAALWQSLEEEAASEAFQLTPEVGLSRNKDTFRGQAEGVSLVIDAASACALVRLRPVLEDAWRERALLQAAVFAHLAAKHGDDVENIAARLVHEELWVLSTGDLMLIYGDPSAELLPEGYWLEAMLFDDRRIAETNIVCS